MPEIFNNQNVCGQTENHYLTLKCVCGGFLHVEACTFGKEKYICGFLMSDLSWIFVLNQNV